MAAAQALTQTTRLLTNIILASLLVPADFGLVAIATIISAFLDQIKDMGTGSAVIQRKNLSHGVLNAIFALNVVVGFCLAALMFGFAAPLASLFGSPAATSVIQAYALITVVTAFGQIHHALLRRELRFGAVASIGALTAVVTAIVSIGLAAMNFGVWSLVLGYGLASLAGTVSVWMLDSWRPSGRVSWDELRPIVGYSTNLMFANLCGFFLLHSDSFLVGRYLGSGPLGIYAFAQRILTYPLSTIANVVGEVVFPVFSHKQDDDAALRSGFIRTNRVVALVTFPVMAGAATIARPAVDVLFGPSWEDLIPLIWILGPVGALQSVTFTTSPMLMAKGRSDLMLRWLFISGVVCVAAYIIGLRWGLVGVAGSYAVAIVILTPFNLMIAFHPIGLRLRTYAKDLLPQVAITLAMVGAVLLTSVLVGQVAGQAVVLVAGVLVGVLSYGALLWLIRPAVIGDALIGLRRRG